MTSEHADTLNALDEMQRAPTYAVRRAVLASAERIIVDQEKSVRLLVADRDVRIVREKRLVEVLRELVNLLGYVHHNEASAATAFVCGGCAELEGMPHAESCPVAAAEAVLKEMEGR